MEERAAVTVVVEGVLAVEVVLMAVMMAIVMVAIVMVVAEAATVVMAERKFY